MSRHITVIQVVSYCEHFNQWLVRLVFFWTSDKEKSLPMWALWSVACACGVFQTKRRVSLCEHFDQWLVPVVFFRQGEESPYMSTLISGLCLWCFSDKEKSPYVSTLISGLCLWCFSDKEKSLPTWALWSVACACGVFQTRRRVSLCEHFDQWLVHVVFFRQGEKSPYVSTLISGLCLWCFSDKEKSLPMWAPPSRCPQWT